MKKIIILLMVIILSSLVYAESQYTVMHKGSDNQFKCCLACDESNIAQRTLCRTTSSMFSIDPAVDNALKSDPNTVKWVWSDDECKEVSKILGLTSEAKTFYLKSCERNTNTPDCAGENQQINNKRCCPGLKECEDVCTKECESGTQFCPNLYSFDGQDYVYEESILETHFTPMMDETIYTKLDYLNSNKINIGNMFDEVEYIDEINVIKATSKKNLYMSTRGDIVELVNPIKVECVSKNNDDCTNLVNKKDSEYISLENTPVRIVSEQDIGKNAYMTDITNLESSEKDYLEITLPENKESNLFIVYSMNPKMAEFEPKFFKEIENILPSVYAMFDNPVIGKLIRERIKDLAFVKIYYLENNEWKQISEFASYSQKEAVISLPKTEKVKIEFTPGMYVFDQISVDYEGHVVESSKVELIKQDFSDLVENNDNKYVQLNNGENLVFEFNEEYDNSYTYFVESNGYYQPRKRINSKSKFNAEEILHFLKIYFDDDYAQNYLLEIMKN